MAAYAQNTTVPADRTRVELERLLAAHGADQFLYASEAVVWILGFRIASRAVRITLPRPDPEDPMLCQTPAGYKRTPAQVAENLAREERRRWRALLLVVKAKLTAVADGISTIEREFMADVILPNGRTLSEWVGPQLARGDMPELMPGGR